ncbi:unnamed protein product [Acanthoscelides obtectus]|uniref:Endonuclease/exonuclease/phosphatase domain-containing protein n=1 Tax=Acanthoscelides obtectus TaxID=200917 RepID=A0A9P0LNS9_ACAOB|nr:unnamed protein product [Acanthoscelides obtectus]CAK1627133.1 hypothetical protein AOBTE_LOCUS4330 [Acanthoscelides obtectus]
MKLNFLINPPSNKITINGFNELLKSLVGEVVLVGDFNAHYPAWGSIKTNYNGRALYEIIESNNLIIMNDGSSTRLIGTGQNPSPLDLTIVSNNLATITHWDSQSANSEYSCLTTRKLIHEAAEKGYNIELAWIPGHSNIRGNETADTLANLGTQLRISQDTKLTIPDILTKAKTKVKEKFTTIVSDLFGIDNGANNDERINDLKRSQQVNLVQN